MKIGRTLLLSGLLAILLAVAATAQTPFVCDGEAYIHQRVNGQLIRIDQTVDPFAFLTVANTGDQINNIGFRRTDGLFYGWRITSPVGLVTIDAAGTVTFLGNLGLPTNQNYNAGEVTPDGTTIYLNQQGTGMLHRVDLAALTVTSVNIAGAQVTVSDWAVHPTTGLLYGGNRNNGRIVVLDPATGVRTELTPRVLPNNGNFAFGGAWFNAAGRLFIYRNNGTIYEVDVSGPAPIVINVQSGGPASDQNDATACINDLIGIAKDMTSADIALPATVDIDYVIENFNTTETLFNLSALEDLTATFGTQGVDWNFLSISSPTAGFANGSFDGDIDQELISPGQTLAPGASVTVNVQIQVLTASGVDANGEWVNQIRVTGENQAGVVFGDLSTDGTDPDGAEQNDSPDEREPTRIAIPPLDVPFVCDGEAYIHQSGQLIRVDQTVDPFTFQNVGGNVGFGVNAIGFRRTDGLIYAWRNEAPWGIITIDANGTVKDVGIPAGLPLDGYSGGDVTADGTTMYLHTNQQTPRRLHVVDLNALTVTSVSISGASGGVHDWAIHPDTGLLYGGDWEGGQVAVLDPVTGVRSDSGSIPSSATPLFYGAAWFDASGRLFLYRNNGAIREIDVSGAVPTVLNVRNGPASNSNDGTACINDLIGAAKDMTTASNGLPAIVDLDYVVENFSSTETLFNLSALEDLTATFGTPGVDWIFQSISSPTAGLVNDLFDGNAVQEMLAPGQSLTPGASVTWTVQIQVLTAAGVDVNGEFVNQILATGENATGAIFGDLSTDGTDPDGVEQDRFPDEREPTRLAIPGIGVAKQLTAISTGNGVIFNTEFTLVVENTGTLPLDNLSLVDDVVSQFGSAFASVSQAPQITASTATADPGLGAFPSAIFDGVSGQLDLGQTITVTFGVNLDASAAGAPSPLLNQAIAGGVDPTGMPHTDLSDSGTDPGGTNPGEPGDTGGPDDPTPVTLPTPPMPALGLAKSVTNVSPNGSNFNVTFAVVMANIGDTTLGNLTLVDDLVAQLGPAFVGVAQAPQITASTASVNPVLSGAFPAVVFDGVSGQLDPGQSLTVSFTVTVDPSAAGAPSPLLNQAVGTGLPPTGGPVTDLSDSGTNPNGTNPGEPGDRGTPDDPTPIELLSVIDVPTLGEWGLALLAFVLGLAALRRMRPRHGNM